MKSLLGSWSVFAAKCTDGSYHIGIAKNIELKLAGINSKRYGPKELHSKLPVTLEWSQFMGDRQKAAHREAHLRMMRPEARVEIFTKGN